MHRLIVLLGVYFDDDDDDEDNNKAYPIVSYRCIYATSKVHSLLNGWLGGAVVVVVG